MEKVGIIMAGGSGNRFWPLSRINRPKQLIKFDDNSPTLLEESIIRASKVIPKENIFIITNQYLKDQIEELITDLPKENIIAEPMKRNTAPCLALASAIISTRMQARNIEMEDIVAAVLTADQRIFPYASFAELITPLMKYVYYNPSLATIGIRPSRPETGYGYIEVESDFDYTKDSLQIQPVLSFHEKPSQEKANEFFHSHKYLWNSGMFFYRLDVFNEKLRKYCPNVGNSLQPMSEIISQNPLEDNFSFNAEIMQLYSQMPDISIDFALMEKAQKVVVAPSTFSWEDLGSYDTLPRIYSVDDNQNYIQGNVLEIDTTNSILINRSSAEKNTLLTILGFSNTVVAVTDDAIMICPLERVQEVKRIVQELDKSNKNNWL